MTHSSLLKQDLTYYMERNSLPKLPWGLEPKLVFWTDEGRSIVIQSDDDKHVYSFRWDGVDSSFQSFVVRLKVELEYANIK